MLLGTGISSKKRLRPQKRTFAASVNGGTGEDRLFLSGFVTSANNDQKVSPRPPMSQPSWIATSRVSDASNTETMVIRDRPARYTARAPGPYPPCSSAVAMNGDIPPASTEEICEPSDAPL